MVSASRSTTRAPFLASASAAEQPVRPPPITATSQLPCTGPAVALRKGSEVSSQYEVSFIAAFPGVFERSIACVS